MFLHRFKFLEIRHKIPVIIVVFNIPVWNYKLIHRCSNVNVFISIRMSCRPELICNLPILAFRAETDSAENRIENAVAASHFLTSRHHLSSDNQSGQSGI
jgi:hypothetical protein